MPSFVNLLPWDSSCNKFIPSPITSPRHCGHGVQIFDFFLRYIDPCFLSRTPCVNSDLVVTANSYRLTIRTAFARSEFFFVVVVRVIKDTGLLTLQKNIAVWKWEMNKAMDNLVYLGIDADLHIVEYNFSITSSSNDIILSPCQSQRGRCMNKQTTRRKLRFIDNKKSYDWTIFVTGNKPGAANICC